MQYSIFDTKNILELKKSFWQSVTWKNILVQSQQVEEAWYFGDPKQTWMLVEIRKIGMGMLGAFALGVTRDQIYPDVEIFLRNLEKYLKEKGVIFFQIEPIEEIPPIHGYYPVDANNQKIFIPQCTRVVNIALSHDEIFAQMKQKGRYHIRQAQKAGVVIQEITTMDDNILDTWMQLFSETRNRVGFAFSGNSREFYKIFCTEILQKGFILLAKYNDVPIAMGIFSIHNTDCIYYYGASTMHEEYKKLSSMYLLQWHAMQRAKEKNMLRYDFLGIACENNGNDPLHGVSTFKEKFGGALLRLSPKTFKILSMKYYIWKIARKIKHAST